MTEGPAIPTGRLTRAGFYAWAEAQPRGRFELLDGVVVAMAPDRGAHLRAKAAAWLALRAAIEAAGVPCQALPDGATVEIGSATAHEPDASVNCGAPMADEALALPNPVVVVEVVSPSTSRVDAVQKLADHFLVPSIQHYLIVDAARRMVIHYRRLADGTLGTRIATGGPLLLDPPGLSLAVEALFG